MIIGMLPIPEFPHYMADIHGRIWSCYSGEWKTLAINRDKDGYAQYTLCENAARFQMRGCYLVLITFVGPRPERMHVCHNDGDCTNDAKDNLRWDYPKNNIADKIAHGTMLYGEMHPQAKITDAEAREIIERRMCGETYAEIGQDYDITAGRVFQIVKFGRKEAL